MLDAGSLRLLHEVARTGSYTAAARELGYSQPAVSYKMRALERAAGVALVVRVGRGMRLTPAGEVLAGHARAVVTALKAADEAAAELNGNRVGRVRIAAFQSACSALLPEALGAIRRQLPEVRLSLTSAAPHEALGMVRAGEVDVAVVFGFDDDPPEDPLLRDAGGLRQVPLLADRVFVQLPAGHPLADREVVTLASLAQERWVVHTPKDGDRLRRACEAAGFTPDVTTTADDTLAQEALVANGLGIGLRPGLLTVLRHDDRVVHRLVDPWPTRRISALSWPDMAKIPAARAVLDALATTAAGLQARLDRELPAEDRPELPARQQVDENA